jgi:hypothetical protein
VVDGIAFSAPVPEFRIAKAEWRAGGTGSTDGKTVTLRLGTAAAPAPGSNCAVTPVNGCAIGTAPVTLGIWTVRVKPGIQPGAATQVTAWSSGGGVSSPSSFTIR